MKHNEDGEGWLFVWGIAKGCSTGRHSVTVPIPAFWSRTVPGGLIVDSNKSNWHCKLSHELRTTMKPKLSVLIEKSRKANSNSSFLEGFHTKRLRYYTVEAGYSCQFPSASKISKWFIHHHRMPVLSSITLYRWLHPIGSVGICHTFSPTLPLCISNFHTVKTTARTRSWVLI